MGTSARTGHQVVNYDEVWERADRWYHVGRHPHQVSLGRNGVPQALVIYALCGAGSAFLLDHAPLLRVLVSWPSPWIAGAALTVLCALAALPRPNGLAVHVFLPIVIADRLGSRHTLGWQPIEDPGARWCPDELIFSDPFKERS